MQTAPRATMSPARIAPRKGVMYHRRLPVICHDADEALEIQAVRDSSINLLFPSTTSLTSVRFSYAAVPGMRRNGDRS
jgi:hypothetical protein